MRGGPSLLVDWQSKLFANYGNPLTMVGVSLLVFPRLALGLSGFETGVSLMPLAWRPRRRTTAACRPHPQHAQDAHRGGHRHELLPHYDELRDGRTHPGGVPEGGSANGRALAYLAHDQLGEAFGTVYDLSTIAILWFAGASALAGLLNIVPRYLPRYGMAPEWARAIRPLVWSTSPSPLPSPSSSRPTLTHRPGPMLPAFWP